MKFHTLPSKHKPPRQQSMLLVSNHFRDRILKFNALTGSPLGTYATVKKPMEIVVGNQDDASDLGRSSEDIFVTSENGVTQFQAPVPSFSTCPQAPHPERYFLTLFLSPAEHDRCLQVEVHR